MTSFAHTTAKFLLLLMCGPAFYQVFAASSSCPLMDMLSLMSGNFYLLDGDRRINDIVIYLPVDNPSLNQYKPFYYKQTWNGEIYLEGISLFAEGSGISNLYTLYFYYFNNLSHFGTPESYLSTITRYDLAAYPNCTENGLLIGDKMESTMSCYIYNADVLYESERTCTYWRLLKTGLDLSSSEFMPLKAKEYPLPASWLEGHEDNISLCNA